MFIDYIVRKLWSLGNRDLRGMNQRGVTDFIDREAKPHRGHMLRAVTTYRSYFSHHCAAIPAILTPAIPLLEPI